MIPHEIGLTQFNSISEIEEVIPKDKGGKVFVVMMNFGEYDFRKIPYSEQTHVDGIRVAFHKKNMIEAIDVCKEIKEKGYKVFVQPMVSLNYSDEEFLDLINRCNHLDPICFYIVDSFGMMKGKDLTRLFYMVEHNLKENIKIGFHSHNNMQLAYSNAQTLVGIQTRRNLLIDSSVYGMGRGAGNLNTELFVEYLNDNLGTQYNLKPILSIIDEILSEFHEINYWGYSLPNYISAAHNAHPNYAGYLDDKKTLTIENMNDIFEMLDEDKKASFDRDYIEQVYIKYMETNRAQETRGTELKSILEGSTVLLIGPGNSAEEHFQRIQKVKNDVGVLCISVNFDYNHIDTDYIFLSNFRRFRELPPDLKGKCIVTSNIPADSIYYQTPYQELLNDVEGVRDNAGLMAIKFLMLFGVKRIMMAGFDGYSHDLLANFARKDMTFITKKAVLDAINDGMSEVIKLYMREIEIEFLTEPKFLHI